MEPRGLKNVAVAAAETMNIVLMSAVAARRRVRTFRTHAPSISLPPRNDFLQKGETGDERARREREGSSRIPK